MNHTNMKKTSIILIIVLIFALIICFTACGNESKGVPDDVAIRSVSECQYAYSNATTYVTHNKYDSESHLDYVTIVSKSEGKYGYFISTCEAVFQYNRTSDLWSLLDAELWTEPRYTFNDNLVGRYDVSTLSEDEEISGYVEILSVTDKKIKLCYDISGDVDIAFKYFEDLHIEKSGTETLVNGVFDEYSSRESYIPVDIKLPEGWVEAHSFSSDNSDDTISLRLIIGLRTGVKSIYLSGEVKPKNSN